MSQNERLIPHTWGQEGISDKIHVKNWFGGPWADFGTILEGKRAISRHSLQIAIKASYHSLTMDQTERPVPHTWGQEGISDNIDGKNCFGGPKADFGTILGGKPVISRHVLQKQFSHPHPNPPMDQTERFIRHIPRVEALSHEIAAQNLIFADWAVLDALRGAFCESMGPSSRAGENPGHSTLPWYHRRLIIKKFSTRLVVWGHREGWVRRTGGLVGSM